MAAKCVQTQTRRNIEGGLRGRQTVLGLKVGSFRARVLATSCARPEHVQRISVSADKRAHLWIGLDSLPVCPSVCVCVYSCPSLCLCVCFLLTKCFDFHWKTGWRTTRLSASSTNLLSCLQARPLLLSLSLPLSSSLSFSPPVPPFLSVSTSAFFAFSIHFIYWSMKGESSAVNRYRYADRQTHTHTHAELQILSRDNKSTIYEYVWRENCRRFFFSFFFFAIFGGKTNHTVWRWKAQDFCWNDTKFQQS